MEILNVAYESAIFIDIFFIAVIDKMHLFHKSKWENKVDMKLMKMDAVNQIGGSMTLIFIYF